MLSTVSLKSAFTNKMKKVNYCIIIFTWTSDFCAWASERKFTRLKDKSLKKLMLSPDVISNLNSITE